MATLADDVDHLSPKRQRSSRPIALDCSGKSVAFDKNCRSIDFLDCVTHGIHVADLALCYAFRQNFKGGCMDEVIAPI